MSTPNSSAIRCSNARRATRAGDGDASDRGDTAPTPTTDSDAPMAARTAATGSKPRLDTDRRTRSPSKLDTDLGNVFPDDTADGAGRRRAPALPAETWADDAVAPAGVSPRTTISKPSSPRRRSLADHLADQLGLAVVGSGDAADRPGADQRDRRGRLSPRRPRRRRRAPRRAAGAGREDAAPSSRPSSRPASAPATSPSASPSSSASATASTRRWRRWSPTSISSPSATTAALRRLCGVDDEDLAEMLAGIRALNPKPGNAFGATHVQPVIPDVIVRPGPDGGWLVELNTGTLPRVLVNQTYYATVAQPAEERRRQGLSRRLPADRELAGEEPRPAGPHDPQGGDRDRAPAGRVPRRGRPASAAAQPEDRRRSDRHARIDRVARHLEQVHGDAARHLRTEIFLHRRRSRRPKAARRIRPRRCASASAS